MTHRPALWKPTTPVVPSLHPVDPRVRPLPYPFRGAVSLANDAEYMTFPFFEALMRFLNTTGSTPLGSGLGLEVTSSFFFYAVAPATTFRYFETIDARPVRSPEADRMDDYLRAGYLDCCHAYGDFDGQGGFRRELALPCYEALGSLGVTVPVFTNHGGSENTQNVGTDAAYHGGDRPGDPAYHADLMQQHGVRYVWTDSMVHAGHLGRRARLQRRLGRSLPAEGVLHAVTLQDGSRMQGFYRLRGTGAHAPNLASWGHQLDQIGWADLYDRQGMMVIYQHFGVEHRLGGVCKPATIEALLAFPEVYLAPFHRLAAEAHSGRLWVVALGRALRYAEMVASVRIEPDADGRTCQLHLPDTFAVGDLGGLTLYLPTTRPVDLTFRGRPIAFRCNGPDHTGQDSVTVPMTKLQEIWE
jgi:hypothetical protein